MTETPALVVRVDEPFAYVEIGPRLAGCGRCHEAGGCGAGSTGSGGKRIYRLPNDIGVRAGDEVMLVVPDGALLKASLLAYLLPVISLIVAAAIGAALSERAAVIGVCTGLAIGLALVRYGQSRMLSAREPLLRMRIKSCAFTIR